MSLDDLPDLPKMLEEHGIEYVANMVMDGEVDVVQIKSYVLAMLVGTYRRRGKDAMEEMVLGMHRTNRVDGVVPIAVELVVALSNCMELVGR